MQIIAYACISIAKQTTAKYFYEMQAIFMIASSNKQYNNSG